MNGISASAHKHLLIHWLIPYPVAAFCLCNTLLLPTQLIITQAPSLRGSWCSFLWPNCVPHQESPGILCDSIVYIPLMAVWCMSQVCILRDVCSYIRLNTERNFEVTPFDFFSEFHKSHPLSPHRLPLSLLSRSSCPVSCLFPLSGPLG